LAGVPVTTPPPRETLMPMSNAAAAMPLAVQRSGLRSQCFMPSPIDNCAPAAMPYRLHFSHYSCFAL
jgi:hypothetical protein